MIAHKKCVQFKMASSLVASDIINGPGSKTERFPTRDNEPIVSNTIA